MQINNGYVSSSVSTYTAIIFKVEGVDMTSIQVTLNPLCHPSTTYTAEVFFGVRQQNSNDTCHPEQNMTVAIVPGESEIFSVDTTALVLKDDQEYCSTNASLAGGPATWNILYAVYVYMTCVICWYCIICSYGQC